MMRELMTFGVNLNLRGTLGVKREKKDKEKGKME